MSSGANPPSPDGYDSWLIFNEAECTRLSAELLGRTANSDSHHIFPHLMLAALAFELYLKCLLCLRGKSIPRKAGHHTKELFDELVQTDRDWIYPGYVSGTDTVLEALDYLFVNTRYRYEMKAPGAKKRPPLNTSKLGQLIHAARKILVRENPDWPERVARGHPKN